MSIYYFKRYRMTYDLNRELWPGSLAAGFRLVAWHPDTLAWHAKAKHLSFQAEVDANVFACFTTLNSCQRLMTEITQREEFLPAATWLVIRDAVSSTDGVAARTAPVIACATVQGLRLHVDLGSIQNLGVVPQFRGLGLGTVILKQALIGFRESGLSKAVLEVTADNSAAVRLYQRLGWEIDGISYKPVEIVARNVPV